MTTKQKKEKVIAVRLEKDIYRFTQDQKDASRTRRQEQRATKGKKTVFLTDQ